MFKYSSYLLIATLKKFSTILILSLFAIFFGVLLYLQIESNNFYYPTIFYLWDYFYYIPFLFGSVYVGVKAVNIFKDGITNGEELLIISKPISRTKIIISKFLIMFFHIVLFSLVVFITAFLASQKDLDKSTPMQIMNFSSSLSIGSFVVCLLMSGLIILSTTILNKLGSIMLSAIIPFLLIVFSAIIIPIAKGGSNSLTTSKYIYNSQVFDPDYRKGGLVKKTKYATHNETFVKRQQSGWYNKIKYLDVFSQFSQLYKMFVPNVLVPTIAIKITPEKHVFNSDLYLKGLNTKGQTVDFIFVASITDIEQPRRTLFTKMIDNKTKITNEVYNYMVDTYNNTNKQHSKAEQDAVKLFVSPKKFDENDQDSIDQNKANIRFKTNMGVILYNYLIWINNKIHKTPYESVFLDYIKHNFFSGSGHHPKTFSEAIKSFKSVFIDGPFPNRVAPTLLSIFIYEKVFPLNKNQTGNPTHATSSGKDAKFIKNFKPLIVEGEYTSNKAKNDLSSFSASVGIIKNNTEQVFDSYAPWVSKQQVFGIWITITLLLTILVVIKYLKTDFK